MDLQIKSDQPVKKKRIRRKKGEVVIGKRYNEPIRTDEEGIVRMGEVGMSMRAIAYIVGCDEKVIRKKFAEKVEKGKAKTAFHIAEKSIELALEGNVTMLIWVAKNILGWTDAQTMPSNQVLTVLKQTINTNAKGEIEVMNESKEIASE